MNRLNYDKCGFKRNRLQLNTVEEPGLITWLSNFLILYSVVKLSDNVLFFSGTVTAGSVEHILKNNRKCLPLLPGLLFYFSFSLETPVACHGLLLRTYYIANGS